MGNFCNCPPPAYDEVAFLEQVRSIATQGKLDRIQKLKLLHTASYDTKNILLVICCYLGRFEMVCLLIEQHGADIYYDESASLRYAKKNSQWEIMQYLLWKAHDSTRTCTQFRCLQQNKQISIFLRGSLEPVSAVSRLFQHYLFALEPIRIIKEFI